jgi:hypothetical protein
MMMRMSALGRVASTNGKGLSALRVPSTGGMSCAGGIE